MIDLLAVAKRTGLVVKEHGNWRSRQTSGTFSPVGQVNHHTASNKNGGNTPSLNVVTNGRSGIPGPLCNILIARNTDLYLISDGRANDTGMGRSDVLDLVRHDRAPNGRPTLADNINCNPWYFDWEFENDGIGEPWTNEMMEAAYRLNTEVAKAMGWTGNRSIGHLESTRRKIDPARWNMNEFRAEINRRLTPMIIPQNGTEAHMELPTLKRGDAGQAVRVFQGCLIAHAEDICLYASGGKLDAFVDGHFGQWTEDSLKAWQQRTQSLVVNGVCDKPVWDWLLNI